MFFESLYKGNDGFGGGKEEKKIIRDMTCGSAKNLLSKIFPLLKMSVYIHLLPSPHGTTALQLWI